MTRDEIATTIEEFADKLLYSWKAVRVTDSSSQILDGVTRREFTGVLRELAQHFRNA